MLHEASPSSSLKAAAKPVRAPAQVIAAVEPVTQADSYLSDPHYCNIEETIDEFERRIKAEEARYARVVANRQHYQDCMEPEEYRLFMRQSAQRLVNYDPNFDTPMVQPQPTPWETQVCNGMMLSGNYLSHSGR